MGRYRIAGLTVEMDVSQRTAAQAGPYQIFQTGPVDIRLECDPAAVWKHNPQIPDLSEAEYLGTGAAFARQLLEHNGLQLHASCVMLKGKAYLFTAPSGTGKSTHTEKWSRLFGAQLLNDDKPALRELDGIWYAFGTPWSGKKDLSLPESAPVGGIAFLQRAQSNRITRLTPADAVPLIMSQCLRLLDARQMDTQLSLLDRLLRQIPVWLLECKNEDAAAQLSMDAMIGGEG